MRILALVLAGIALGTALMWGSRVSTPHIEPVPLPKSRPVIETPAQYEARLARIRNEIECLTVLVYTEARGESELGQYLVAWVGLQRHLDQRSDFGRGTLCDVVYRQLWNSRQKRWVSMFAGPIHNGRKVNRVSYQYRHAFYVAWCVYSGQWVAPEQYRLARYYYNPTESDAGDGAWHETLMHIGRVGRHVFSKDSETAEGSLRTPPLLLAAR